MIGPHSEVKGKNKSPGRIIINFKNGNVKAVFEKMKATGAEVIAEPHQSRKDDKPEVWLATLAAPDGNYFQLASTWDT